jgi:HAE1 family hydrophobic/amphiphilic exporter-1
MSVIATAVRRRVTVAMATVATVLFGLLAFFELPVTLLPDFSYPTLTVRTDYDGAAPAEIEALVTRPLEDALGVVGNLQDMRSTSQAGQSDVVLAFQWGTDMDAAGLDVRERLDTISLPPAVGRPTVLRFDPSTDPVVRLSLAGDSERPLALRSLRSYADEQLKRQLEVIVGVAAISVAGGLEEEVEIRLDAERLSEFGLATELVINRLRAENVNLAGGTLREGDRRYLVRTLNEFPTVEAFKDLIVARRDGRNIVLGDVAEVVSGAQEREAIIRLGEDEAIEVAIYKEGDANTVRVAENIEEALPGLRKQLPEGYRLSLIDDQSQFIRQAITEVIMAGLLGGLFAVIVLYLFLGQGWATLAISLAIPVSVVGSFFLMRQADVGLNIMSLGGMALAIGLLVDNAIVVLENIARHHRELGRRLSEAVVSGTQEVASAVTASTLTTIAVFLPLVFVEGLAGQLFRDQALTVAFALILSLLVALLLLPVLVNVLAPDGEKLDNSDRAADQAVAKMGVFSHVLFAIITFPLQFFLVPYNLGKRFVRAIARLFGRLAQPLTRRLQASIAALTKRYQGWLGGALDRPWVVLGVALLSLGLTAMLTDRLGMELLPEMAQGKFEARLEFPPGTALASTDAQVLEVQRRLSALPAVAAVHAVSGTGARLDANPTDSGEHIAQLLIRLRPPVSLEAESQSLAIMREALSDLPDMQISFSRPALFAMDSPLMVEVVGQDLEQLRLVGDLVAQRLREKERFSDVRSNLEEGFPEVRIYFDQAKIVALGLEVRQVADEVVRQLRGEVATRFSVRDERVGVRVRLPEQQRQRVDDLAQMVINPGGDKPLPLSAVAELDVGLGPAEILRTSQQRSALVSANLSFGSLDAAVEEAEAVLASIPLPPGLSADVTGQSEDMQRSFASLQFALLLAVFLVYLVLASQFESLLHPLLILGSIPLAGVGAVLALWITNTALSVVVFIGLIMLVGIVVNNAIVLIDRINQLRAEGQSRREAILEAGSHRLRPILMTTATTVLGLLPMAIGLGEGSELRAPMGVAVIGGLALSTLLTLFVIPVLYFLADRKSYQANPSDAALEASL